MSTKVRSAKGIGGACISKVRFVESNDDFWSAQAAKMDSAIALCANRGHNADPVCASCFAETLSA